MFSPRKSCKVSRSSASGIFIWTATSSSVAARLFSCSTAAKASCISRARRRVEREAQSSERRLSKIAPRTRNFGKGRKSDAARSVVSFDGINQADDARAVKIIALDRRRQFGGNPVGDIFHFRRDAPLSKLRARRFE